MSINVIILWNTEYELHIELQWNAAYVIHDAEQYRKYDLCQGEF
jgi:hypothetical protein